MRYIDADKLIAKIENMFDNGYYCTPKNIGKQRGRNNVCRKILSLITSLQQEQEEVDLEKEYNEFVISDPVYSKLCNGIVGKAIAKHFYQLGSNVGSESKIKGWVARDKDWRYHFFLTKPQYYDDFGEWSNGGERYLIPGELCGSVEDDPIEVELLIKRV